MSKIRILGIAPYEGIRNLMLQAAAKRENVELNVYVGDLEIGTAIASRYRESDLDVIISRGGTAELIRKKTSFPVVDIPLSVYDIFRSIKLAENYSDKYALVGFPAITKNAHFLCDMLRYDIDIYTIHNKEEAASTLKKLIGDGCHMVLCDMVTNSLAQQYGLTSILIASGTESIESAFDAAIQIAQSRIQLKSEIAFTQMILNEHPWPVMIFDAEGNDYFASGSAALPSAMIENMRTHVPIVLESGEKKLHHEYSGLLYSLAGYRKSFGGKTFAVYYVSSRKLPISLSKNGIRSITREEAADNFFSSFYSTIHSTQNFSMSIEQYAQSRAPLVILGEPGTGKESLAKLIYTKSELQHNPMVIIDCARISQKGWNFLMEHSSSPFSDIDTTIYLKNMSILSDAQIAELVSIIADLNLTSKNRFFFTFRYDPDGSVPARCRKILDSFSCLRLEIEPTRMHLDDIPNLVSLYISNLNIYLAKEIVGVETEGLKLLTEYTWPGNYEQFQRIMQELVSTATTPYITTDAVSRLLRREMPAVQVGVTFDLSQTLEEINLDILRQVLAEEGGNQSSTAKRLGISRTTLWRMIQKL